MLFLRCALAGLALAVFSVPVAAQVQAPTWIDESGKPPPAPARPDAARSPTPVDSFPERIDPSVMRAADDEPPPPRPGPRGSGSAPARAPTSAPAAASGERVDEKAGETPVGFGEVKATDAYRQIMALWKERRQAIQEHQGVVAAERLAAIGTLFRRAGGSGALGTVLRDIGVALARESLRALEEKDAPRAAALAETAALFAADVGPVHLALARARFAHNPGDIQGVATALRSAVVAAVEEPGSAVGLALGAVVVLLVALVVAVLAAAVTLLLRTATLIAHDIRHLLPRGVSYFQAVVLLCVLSLLPVLLKLGPLFTALCFLALAWAYLSVRERRVMLALWLSMLAAPGLVHIGARLLGPDAQDAILLHEASRDLGLRDARARVDALRSRAPDDPLPVAVLAVVDKRDGELQRARDEVRAAIALAPEAAWLHNNYGNILALEGDFEAALGEYQRACDLAPGLFEPHFNIANLYFRQRKMAQARSAAAIAMAIDQERFDRTQAATDGAKRDWFNEIVVDMNLSTGELLRRVAASQHGLDRYQREASALLFCGLPPPYMAGAILGGALLLVLIGSLARRLRPAHACPRCGKPACLRCDADLPTHDVCGQCYYAFLAPPTNIDANLKIRKEIEVRRYKTRRETTRRLISFVLVGSGHLLAGAPLRGSLMLILLGLLLSSLLLLAGAIPMPFAVESALPLGRLIAIGLLLVLLYLWAVLSARRIGA
ncbi:MAG: tetratricopeptide repeat protein [Deltaproteobacteria bacterium]|nr:tetratricopeptide repeat protein [Deltaproteobacteria bacterium]